MAVWKKLLTAAEATTTFATLDNTTLEKLVLEANGPYITFHDDTPAISIYRLQMMQMILGSIN